MVEGREKPLAAAAVFVGVARSSLGRGRPMLCDDVAVSILQVPTTYHTTFLDL